MKFVRQSVEDIIEFTGILKHNGKFYSKPSEDILFETGWRLLEEVNKPSYYDTLFNDVVKTFNEIEVNKKPTLRVEYSLEYNSDKAMETLSTWTAEVLNLGALENGYDSIISAVAYQTSANPQWQEEGRKYKVWQDACWEYCYDTVACIEQGEITSISESEFKEGCPKLEIEE